MSNLPSGSLNGTQGPTPPRAVHFSLKWTLGPVCHAGTSGTLAPGHSATTSLGGGMLPGAADAGQLLEAAGPAQQPNGAEGVPPPQSPTDLDDFMDWLVEQPDCVNEWLSSVEMEQSNLALPPVRTTAERHDCQVHWDWHCRVGWHVGSTLLCTGARRRGWVLHFLLIFR